MRRARAVLALLALSAGLLAPGPAVAAPRARLRVTQTVDPTTYDRAGQTLTWTSVVTNAGDVELAGLAVTDASRRLSARTCAPVPLGGTLAAGASTTCTATDRTTQADVDAGASRTDAVTATATTSAGETINASASATASAPSTSAPGLSLSATASPASVSRPGQAIAYAVLVGNRGNETVRDLVVTNPIDGLSALVCAPVALGGALAPDQTTTCRADRSATVADLGRTVLTGVVKATARTKTAAVNASTRVTVAVRAGGPVAPDQSRPVVDGGDPVVLPGGQGARPGESDGPAIDPGRTVIVEAGQSYGGKQYDDGGLTWLVAPDGRVRVAPVRGQHSTSGSVTYRVYDLAGRSATGTLRVTVRRSADSSDDTGLTKQGRPVTVTVLANDDSGQTLDGSSAGWDTGTLRLDVYGAYPETGATDTVPGKGTFSVGDGGTVVFTPLPAFSGEAKATYTVASRNGSTTTADLTVTAVGVAPTTNGPETRTTLAGQAVTFPAARDDRAGDATVPLDPAATVLVGPGVDSDGKTLRAAAGTWLVQADGSVRLQPRQGFSGTGSVSYAAVDRNGTQAWATLTATVRPGPRALPHTTATPVGRPVTLDPLGTDVRGQRLNGTTASFVGSSLVLVAPVEGAGGVLDDDGRRLTVPGQGVWTVAGGRVTFAPDAGFSGAATGQSYAARDDAGSSVVGRLDVAVVGSGPVATPDFARTPTGSTVRLAGATDDLPGAAPLRPGDTVFPADGQPGGSVRSADGKSLRVPGEGTWTVAADGSAAFAPEPTFAGTTREEVAYEVVDAGGARSRAQLQVMNEPAPVAGLDEVRVGLGVGNTANATLTANDVPGTNADTTLGTLDPGSVEFPVDGQAPGWTIRTPTFAQYASGGTVVFVRFYPESGTVTLNRLSATASARLNLRYSVRDTVVDASGASVQQTTTSTLSIDLRVSPPPRAVDDTGETTSPYAVDLSVLNNDVPGDPSVPLNTDARAVSFPTTGQPSGSVVDNAAYPNATVTVPGEGVWSSSQLYPGPVTFEPVAGFVGTTRPVRYAIRDVAGGTATASMTVLVRPGATTHPDTGRTVRGVPTTIDVIANDDPGFDADGTRARFDRTVVLLNGADKPGSTVSPHLDVVTVPGEGRYTVQRVTGDIAFVPDPAFVGTASRVWFEVLALTRTSTGFVQTSYPTSSLQVTVDPVNPTSDPDTASTRTGEPVVVPVLANDTPGAASVPLAATSVRLRTEPGLPTGSALYADTKTLVVPGRGVFLVAGSGEITFVPLGTWTGSVTVGYSVADGNGTRARSTLTVPVSG